MDHIAEQNFSEIKQYLSIYKIEPIGWIFVDKLRLPIPVVGGIFVLLYFGVLLVLHGIAGHPTPSNFEELFRHPSTYYYYPNLIGITYDLIGNPLFFVFLVVFRGYIPGQFIKLKQDTLIKEKPPLSRLAQLGRLIAIDKRAQIIAMIVIPLSASLFTTIMSILVFQPPDIPGKYAIFLTFLGAYAKSAILVQLTYIFLILNNYSFDIKLTLIHPDHCSGLAPFGNLAISSYLYLLFWAIFQAIGISAGGGALGRSIVGIPGSASLVYLWLLFPLAIFFVFDQLVYKPHKVVRSLQREYLEAFNQNWTRYHQSILSNLTVVVETSQKSSVNESDYNFKDQLELLEVWAKLEQYISDLHTWPVSKTSFRMITLLANPFIPLLIPIVVEFVGSLVS